MRALRTALVGAATAVLLVPAGIGSAVASDDDRRGDQKGDHDDGVEVDVVASGLNSPRGLAISRRGDLYIAQSGRGGDGPCFVGAEGPTCLGASGVISRLSNDDDDDDRRRGDGDGDGDGDGEHGSVVDVVTGLPSLGLQGTGNNAIGPSDLTFGRRGTLYATIGLGADPAVRTTTVAAGGLGGSPLALQLGTVLAVDARSGTATQIADVAAHEAAENPDGGLVDSNGYSIASGGGYRVVADAGANALVSVDRDGDVETLAVFPNEAPVQNPFAPPGVTIEPQAVPNSVVRGPDGAFYVGQLTGFPFEPGTATVWRVVPGEEPTVYAEGFTNIIDLAFTDKGNLLVLEIARGGLFGPIVLQNGAWGGALIEVSRHDTSRHTTLLEDPLFAPGGMAVDDDDVYISNRSVFAGEGEIFKVELDD